MIVHYISDEALKLLLLARVEQGPGCWIWKGWVDSRGYSILHTGNRSIRASRAAYKVYVGPIPPGHEVHHTCGCRNCVNPEHLQVLPHKEHMRSHSLEGTWQGTRNGRAKLTEADVRYIRGAGKMIPPASLAERLGVSIRTIYRNRREGWRHVEPSGQSRLF